MRKIVIFFVFLLTTMLAVFAQTEPTTTQYMLNNAAFNPAAVGSYDLIQVGGQHRIHWAGTPNAGQTTVFQLNMPFKLFNAQHGAGIKFKNDKAGQFYYRGMHLQYAYKTRLANGVVSFGTDLGVLNAGFYGDSIVMPAIGEEHNKEGDVFLQMGTASGTVFDMALGAFYKTDRYYAGISYQNLTNPTVLWSEKNEYKMTGTAYLTGGYTFVMVNPKFEIIPSVLLMSNFTVAQIDISGLLRYDEKYWGGLSFRWGNALGVILGMNVIEGLRIGYAYDVPLSPIASWGSHEISVRYEFALASKNNNKHKSVRIL